MTVDPGPNPGDINLDLKVDIKDLYILATNFGTTAGATWDTGDMNSDGAVDANDLGILAEHWQTDYHPIVVVIPIIPPPTLPVRAPARCPFRV